MKTSWEVRFLRGFLIGALSGALISLWIKSANAYSVDEDGFIIIPEPVVQTCTAKGDVTAFVYKHRDLITEADALTLLERDWNDVWGPNPNIKRHEYVDMQRIVRDAYRTNRDGSHMRDCCEKDNINAHVKREVEGCLNENT